jgi:hypothetical protein
MAASLLRGRIGSRGMLDDAHAFMTKPVDGNQGLAGVDIESEDCVYFHRLVAAKYGSELPTG